MADNSAIAVGACRREHLDGALEAIKGVGLAIDRDVDALVVLVSAAFANLHGWEQLAGDVPLDATSVIRESSRFPSSICTTMPRFARYLDMARLMRGKAIHGSGFHS
jgi:hypothetical protein